MTFISKINPSGCFNMLVGAVIVGAFSFSLVSTAEASPARDTEEVSFTFYRNAPAVETYKDFERMARRACDVQSTAVAPIQVRLQQRECTSDLLSRAVEKANIPALTRYHADQAAPAPRTTISSSR